MDEKLLTLAVSTIGNRFYDFSKVTTHPNVTEAYFIQDYQQLDSEKLTVFCDNIHLLDGIGVARSRNSAVEKCQTPYIWFLDDDVTLTIDALETVVQFIKENSPDILLVSVDQGTERKTVPHVVRRHDLLSVGTVQIIVNVELVKRLNVFFPVNMGAGTKYPVCDEPVFLNRLWKNGCKFSSLPAVAIYHPGEGSGSVLNLWGHAVSRGMLFREFFGIPLCVAASLFFLAKRWKKLGRNFLGIFVYGKPY